MLANRTFVKNLADFIKNIYFLGLIVCSGVNKVDFLLIYDPKFAQCFRVA